MPDAAMLFDLGNFQSFGQHFSTILGDFGETWNKNVVILGLNLFAETHFGGFWVGQLNTLVRFGSLHSFIDFLLRNLLFPQNKLAYLCLQTQKFQKWAPSTAKQWTIKQPWSR